MNSYIESYQSVTPIFICGHYRSGTSLLNHLLDGHPDLVAIPIETKFFTAFLPGLSSSNIDEHLNASLLRHFNKSDDVFQRSYGNIDKQAFESVMNQAIQKRQDATAPSAYLEAYVEACILSSSVSRRPKYWVEKTPMNEVFADEIIKFWPNAQFIHVIRDPRDLHHTIRNRSEFPLHPRTTAHNWLRSVEYMNRNQVKFGSKKYLTLRYEDLVAQPESVMKQVAQFMNISFENSLLSPTRALGGETWEGNALNDQYKGISTKSVEKWRDSKSMDEIKLVEAICKKTLVKMGYELEFRFSFKDNVLAVFQRLIIVLKRFRQFLKGQKKATY